MNFVIVSPTRRHDRLRLSRSHFKDYTQNQKYQKFPMITEKNGIK